MHNDSVAEGSKYELVVYGGVIGRLQLLSGSRILVLMRNPLVSGLSM